MKGKNMIFESAQADELNKWTLTDFDLREDLNDSYESKDKIVIICGCGRSGTTLLRAILDTHSQLAAGPESLLFLPIRINFEELAKKFEMSIQELQDLYDASSSRADFIDKFKDLYLKKHNKLIWVDKTARNVHRLGYIHEHFPNAKIVHVVRDGRDVVASLKTHKKRRVSNGKLEPTGYVMPLKNCINRYLLAVNDGIKFRENSNYFEIKYENIVLNTESALRELCKFLEVKFESTMLRYYEIDSVSRNPLNFPQNVEATRPISSKSIGRWQRDFSEDEIGNVTSKIKKTLDFLGYDSKNSKNILLVERKPYLAIPLIDAPVVDKFIDNDMIFVKDCVRHAFEALYHERSSINLPSKCYLQRSNDAGYSDRITAMPFYMQGVEKIAGIKWIGSNKNNHLKGINRANSVIVLNDIETNAPVCFMDGSVISSMRTLAISLLSIDRLRPHPKKVACIGMGRLGQMHATVLPSLYPSIEEILCYSDNANYEHITDSKVKKCHSWEDAVSSADVVITATATNTPYISADNIFGDKLIINLSLMDFDVTVFQKSSIIIIDDWKQCLGGKNVFRKGIDSNDISKENVVEFGRLLFDADYHPSTSGLIMVNAAGAAIEDVFVAKAIYENAMNMSTWKPHYFYMDNRINPFKEKVQHSVELAMNANLQTISDENKKLQSKVTELQGIVNNYRARQERQSYSWSSWMSYFGRNIVTNRQQAIENVTAQDQRRNDRWLSCNIL